MCCYSILACLFFFGFAFSSLPFLHEQHHERASDWQCLPMNLNTLSNDSTTRCNKTINARDFSSLFKIHLVFGLSLWFCFLFYIFECCKSYCCWCCCCCFGYVHDGNVDCWHSKYIYFLNHSTVKMYGAHLTRSPVSVIAVIIATINNRSTSVRELHKIVAAIKTTTKCTIY